MLRSGSAVNWFLKDVELEAGGRRVVATGELDLAAAPSLEDAGDRAMGDGVKHLELDLREVSFIDSTSIRSLLRIHDEMLGAGGQLVVRCDAGNVLRVLEIAGVDKLLTVLRPDPHPVITEPVERLPR
jgi:anti-sigma B factor antagonist